MAIAFIQSKSGTGSGAGAATTASMTSTSGNAIIVMVATNTNVDNRISTVTDSKFNSYTRVTSKSYNFSEVEIWYALGITGGASHTVTATSSNAGDSVVVTAQEFSGVATSSAADKFTQANGDGNTLDSGATATTTQADELVFGAGADNGGNAVTLGSGYSNLGTATLVGDVAGGAESKIVAATGTYNATFGTSGAPSWVCAVATFKAAGGSAASAIASRRMMSGFGT